MSVSTSAVSVDGSDSATLTAVVQNDNHALGVSWSLSGPGTLSNTSTTSATYTAPATTTSAQTATITATSREEETRYATTAVTIPVAPAITTNSSALAGIVGTTYSVQLSGSGGVPPYIWAVASGSTLPAGLSLSTAGVLSGIPLAGGAGTTNVLFVMTDAGTPTPMATSHTLGVSIAPAPAITFAGTMPASGITNQAYTGSAAAVGGAGALTYSLLSGALPPGLALNSATGAVTGTIAASGTYNFTIKAADAFGDSASQGYQIVIGSQTVTISPGAGALTTAFVGQGYSQVLTVLGGTGSGYVWTVAGLSDGLTSSANGTTLKISGTPTTTGTVSFSAKVTDGSGYTPGTLQYTIPVYTPLTLPAPNPVTLPATATINAAYAGTIAASGGSGTGYTYTVAGLPANGLNYSSSGGVVTISGTPMTANAVTFSVSVKDSLGLTAGPVNYTITPYAALTLQPPNPTTLGSGDAGSSYSGSIAVGGGGGNYTWTVTGFPSDNLSYSTAGSTLTVTGIPSSATTVSFGVSVKDNSTNISVGPYTYTITAYGALALPAPNPASLAAGYTTVLYTGTIGASGGSGSYSWQVTGLSDGLTSSQSGGTLTVSGTPTTAATVGFNVTLTDTMTNASVSQAGYSVAITVPTPVTLPTPNPPSLPSALVNQLYAGSITASGGVPPYTWSINGATMPKDGTPVLIADGISVSSNGSNTLSVGGTPTANQTVNLTNVKVVDYLSSTQTNSYTILVNGTSQLTGQVALNPVCGSSGVPVPTITVELLTNPGGTLVQTTTTDPSGNFSFSTVTNGNYTIVPSITGPSSMFYPSTQNVSVGSDTSGVNFYVALGYTVSGTVSYSGANTGQIYLSLNTSTNCGTGALGTSVFTPGPFTIRGVPPGNYTLNAWMDLTALSNGAQNTSDPAGNTPVTVAAANVTGAAVTITDNTPSAVPSANPTIKTIAPTDQGVAISFKAVTSNGVEAATSYDVQWSTSSTFASATTTYNFKAVGTGSNVWILNNGTAGVSGNPFTNGQTYYFEVRARNAAGPASSWTVYGGGTPIGVAIGASTSGNEVQGTVTIPSGVTPTGPLYVGYYNQSTNTVYGTRIASPGGSNPFTVYVPSDANNDYTLFEILDQNNDGLIDAGDVTNVRNNSGDVAITGPLTGQNLMLGIANSTATATTQYYSIKTLTSNATGYNLNFDVREGNKLPVAVTLLSGPNVINPVDISNYCPGCGNVKFQYQVPIDSTMPSVGDTYSFKITYSDSSSDTETITSAVTGWNGTNAVVGSSDSPSGLLPNDQAGLAPQFTWTDPSADSTDLFSYSISDPSGNIVWQIPGSNSSSMGLPSSITSLTWGTDPTDPNNDLQSGVVLLDSTNYTWYIQAQDSNGNQALTQVMFGASGFL